MSLSIIITTYEGGETLSRCLGTLVNQEGIDDVDVQIIDDGSRSDLRALERTWKPKFAKLAYTKISHTGRAGARNYATQTGESTRILFLDNDIIARPGWLKSHREIGGYDAGLAVTGPFPLHTTKEEEETCSPPYLDHREPISFTRIENPRNVGFERFVSGNLSMDRNRFGIIIG